MTQSLFTSELIKKELFSMKGQFNRLNRERYIKYSLLIPVIMIAIGILSAILGAILPILGKIGMVVILVLSIASIWSGICLGVKRLHDLDKTGWLLLLGAVPLVNFGLFGYLVFVAGTKGPNKYGPDPLAQQ